jgi:hypothetical protein
MKSNVSITGWLALAALATFNLQPPTALAQGTAFTYQGQLTANGSAATGIYDLRFTIYDAVTNGDVVSGVLTNAATPVTNGLFTVTLDFGAGVFTGPARWLEVDVRTNGNGAFTPLVPRQALTPSPYAVYSATAGSATTATTAASVPASGIGAGTANINISGSALSAAYAGTAVAANIATTATTATTATNLIGNVADAQLSANIPRLTGTNSFTGTNTFAGVTVATNVNNVIAGSFLGNGSGLTNLNTAQFANSVLTNGETGVTLGGTFNGNATTATTANNFSGSLSGDVTGTQGATVVASVGGQTAANVASGVSAANAATSAATANTIVKRDASGSFTNTSITLNGNLNLPATTASAGIIYSGGSTLIQSYGIGNFFAGSGAGNTTMATSVAVDNTGVGCQALHSNTNGDFNTACGEAALYSNTNGSANTANGMGALNYNTSGNDNTANGFQALLFNTSGYNNTANGANALFNNTDGSYNIALGCQAGYNITTGSSNIDIGNLGLATDTNIIRIGSGQTTAFIAGVINGNGGGLTSLNAANLASGTIPLAQLPATVVTNNEAGVTLNGLSLAGITQVSSNLFMNNNDIQLRNDLNQGVGWYGAGKLFSGLNVDGPVLYGYSGGGLGYHNNNYGTNLVLYWNNSGYVGIGNTSPGYLLVVGTGGAYCNGTTWVNGSDRNSKEDFAAVNPREVLAKVSALPITEWKYKAEADGSKHLGPMAQDFHAAFGLNGPDDKHIATVDESGVALAAIQGLNQKVEEKDAEIQELKQSVAELKAMVEKLAGK